MRWLQHSEFVMVHDRVFDCVLKYNILIYDNGSSCMINIFKQVSISAWPQNPKFLSLSIYACIDNGFWLVPSRWVDFSVSNFEIDFDEIRKPQWPKGAALITIILVFLSRLGTNCCHCMLQMFSISRGTRHLSTNSKEEYTRYRDKLGKFKLYISERTCSCLASCLKLS